MSHGVRTPTRGLLRICARRPVLLPVLAVLTVAVVWGVSFTVVERATNEVAAVDLVAWRFGLAALLLLPAALRARTSGPSLRRGVVLGLLLGAGFLLQTLALTWTDAARSGFLTGTLVVFAPVLAWLLFRQALSRPAIIGVLVAGVGVAVLGCPVAGMSGLGRGETLTLTAAALWGLHLVLLARWAAPGSTAAFACLQTATVAALGAVTRLVTGLTTGGPLVPAVPTGQTAWLQLLFLAVVATGAAMALLTWAQARLSATRAAVLLTVEPVAAALTAVLLGADLGVRTVLGGALMLGAMLAVESGSFVGERIWNTDGSRRTPVTPIVVPDPHVPDPLRTSPHDPVRSR